MGIQIRPVGKKVRIAASLVAIFALVAQPMYGLVASQVAGAVSGTANDLQTAINSTAEGGTVTLTGNVILEQQISINKDVTIDGAGLYSITANYTRTNYDNDAIIGVYNASKTATLRNVTLDGGGISRDLHGVDVICV
ncbi:MAG TPA: hypothetical protein PKD19_03500 [Candidatus Saccharibacteria bacterium]|nr:hypothetical protein [Candidatus Saccharibacteria bacterium]